MKKLPIALLAASAMLAPAAASADATIDNGTIRLGVRSLGDLNTGGVGVRDLRTGREGTYDGCTCEGWGAAIGGTSITGYANSSVGTAGLNLVSFTSTATTATSTVSLTGGPLTVSHVYSPSIVADLYQVNVTITNTGTSTTAGNILYRRTMDWDIQPTAFDEYSTIRGGVGAKNVVFTSNDGFASSNPLASRTDIGATGDFTDFGDGTLDQGALFDFSFDPLAAGASRTFTIFYGAALSEASALTALGRVGAEIYSFGQSRDDKNGGTPGYSTFIFGFQGVGGTTLPGGVPEPATWALMILGFGAVGGAMRRRRGAPAVRYA